MKKLSTKQLKILRNLICVAGKQAGELQPGWDKFRKNYFTASRVMI